jgi:trk system potassium uptake protein
MGCGRVGSTLANSLQDAGHSVAIIDQSREAFRRLGSHFDGLTITGVGFDRDTLLSAGIDRAGAFAAVSNGDNSNIIAARVARETFGVHNVVARIYDPARAEIYQRLGIPTVATVLWTTDQVLRRITPEGVHTEWRDATGAIHIAEVIPHDGWFGERLTRLETATRSRVAFITRLAHGILPAPDMVLQEGDLVHLVIDHTNDVRVQEVISNPPRSE